MRCAQTFWIYDLRFTIEQPRRREPRRVMNHEIHKKHELLPDGHLLNWHQPGSRTRTIAVICKGSEKMRGHEMKNARRCAGTFSTGMGCGWNLNSRRKNLIFRKLRRFFTIFHPFLIPYFSQKMLVFRILCKTHGYKRHNKSKCKVENAKLKTEKPNYYHRWTPMNTDFGRRGAKNRRQPSNRQGVRKQRSFCAGNRPERRDGNCSLARAAGGLVGWKAGVARVAELADALDSGSSE